MAVRTGIDRTRARGTVADVESATEQLRRSFAVAERNLTRELETITERLALDPAWRGGAARREQLRGVFADLAEMRADLDRQAQLFARGSLSKMYVAGYSRANRALGLDPGAGSFSAAHRRALEVLATDTFDDLAAATSFVEQRAKHAIREATRLGVIVGAASGTSVPQDTAALLGRFRRDGVTAFTAANGARWRLSTYAEMVVRTKSASAYNTGTVLRAREVGTDVFEIRDGDRSGHEECLRYNGSTCSGSWAFANPIEHPNCVRSFLPLPLHTGPVDHGEQPAAGNIDPTLTDDQAAAVRELTAGDLDLDGANPDAVAAAVARLPTDRPFDVPAGLKVHGHTLGPARSYVERGRLYTVERAAADGYPGGIDAFLGAIRRETARAIPRGAEVGMPLRSVTYAAGRNAAEEAAFGFGIGGLAGRRGVSMYYTADRSGLDKLNLGTLTHEVGHAVAHAANRRAYLLADEALDAYTAAQTATYRATPRWLQDAADRSPWWADDIYGTATGPQLVARFGADRQRELAALYRSQGLGDAAAVDRAFAEVRAEATAFVRARNTQRRTVTARVDALEGLSDLDLADLRDNLARIRPGTYAERFTSATPGRAFYAAGESDAMRLANASAGAGRFEPLPGSRFARVDLDGARWNLDDRPSLDGFVSFDGRPTRPGVTTYAASVPDAVEDWAESWRLFLHDRVEGSLGTARTTVRDADGFATGAFVELPIRFADLFPARAAYFDRWASALGWDLPS